MAENHKIPMSIALNSKFIWTKEEVVWQGRKWDRFVRENQLKGNFKKKKCCLTRQYGALMIYMCKSSGYLLGKKTQVK